MKTKSEAKRQTIMAAASVLFQQRGFEPTSMESIAAAALCSKVTLYSYFESKEHLFYEAIVEPIDVKFRDLYRMFEDAGLPIDSILQVFGERFIELITSKPVRMMRQLLMAASITGPTPLSTRCLQAGPERGLEVCTDFFARRADLRIGDAQLAGLQLRALLEAEWLDTMLYGSKLRPARQKVKASASRAVDAFLAIYGEAQ